MRKIRGLCRMLLAVALILSILVTSAFASEYDSVAQELKTLGLFQGTDSGFDLDRAPTRAEAAVMLVRMLGKESTAKSQYLAGTVTNPFTDVEDWAKSYVSWLYTNNLAKGVSSSTFGSTGKCSAKMYCTFVLRALGYSDAAGGDFTFDGSLTYAENVGIFSSSWEGDVFLRDHAVAVSYEALGTYLDDGSKTLLEKLVSDGAVSQLNAGNLLTKVKAYNGYLDAYMKWYYEPSVSMTVNETRTFKSTELKSSIRLERKSISKYIVDSDYTAIESIRTIADGDNTYSTSLWLRDGVLYYKKGSQKTKTNVGDSDTDTLLSDEYALTEPPIYSMSDIKTITAASTQYGKEYSITLSSLIPDMDNVQSDFEGMTIKDVTVNNSSIKVCVDTAGVISSVDINIDFTVTCTYEGQTVHFSCGYTYNSKVNATGDAVSISYPDFSDYIMR